MREVSGLYHRRGSNLTLRNAIVGVESRVGVVRLLVFQIQDGTEASRIYFSPISRLYGSGLLLWFTESPEMAGRAQRDDAAVDLPLMRFTAAYLA